MNKPNHDSMDSAAVDIEALRKNRYNGTIILRRDIHDDLAIFRVRPDDGFSPFEAGQYVALGLGNWEPRIANTQDEGLAPEKRGKMARRAYSISCPMCDSEGNLLDVNSVDYLEFYIALVRHASSPEGKPPALTPRLFGLQSGDRIEIAKKIVGHYVVGDEIGKDDTVLLVGTGTGEAPHNAIAIERLSSGHRGQIINVTCVRHRIDLAYLEQHHCIEAKYPNYHYVPLTTREPENIDSSHPQYVGKQYVQDVFRSGKLAESTGVDLSPATTHAFLCGNPAMIGYTPPGAPEPTDPGMLQVLREFGFSEDHDQTGPGTIRFEKYW